MRFRQGFEAAAWAVLLAATGACGASGIGGQRVVEVPAQAGPPTALPVSGGLFVAGESMRFELSLRGILGGEADLAVGQPGVMDGKSIIIIRSRVESAGVVAMFREVRDEVTTWVDLSSGLPVSQRAQTKYGSKEAVVETKFAGGAPGSFAIDLRALHPRRHKILHQSMPPDQAAFDTQSVLGALRAWKAQPGAHAYFYALIGHHLWQNTVRMTGHEKVKTHLGTFDAIRIDGVARRLTTRLREDHHKQVRYFTMWISDDSDRLPLRVVGKTEFGEVKAELVDYQRPAQTLRAGD